MDRRRVLALIALSATGCVRHPVALSSAPMPGIIGAPRYSTDDNSTSERVSFQTRADEWEVRHGFEEYCLKKRGMKLDTRPSAGSITWYRSDKDFMGILVASPWVTYFYNQ